MKAGGGIAGLIAASGASKATTDAIARMGMFIKRGTKATPEEIKELQDMYDKMTNEMQYIGDESVGFCSITEHLTKEDCEEAGGTWTELDTDTDFDNVDTSALSNELAKQMEELERCFSSPELKNYLNEL